MAVFLFIGLLMGCGVSNITNRGEYIDEQSFIIGGPRQDILARFGAPLESKKDENGCWTDLYRVAQGETTSGKIAKGSGLLILDVFTFGLAEIVATPTTRTKEYVLFEIKYDKDEKIQSHKFLQK